LQDFQGVLEPKLGFYAVIDMIETTLNVWSDSTVAAMVNHDLGKDEKDDEAVPAAV
jgi:Na+/H+-dicarboxylate symporter